MIRSSTPLATGTDPNIITLGQRTAIDDGIGLDVCWRVLRRYWRMIAMLVAVAVGVVGTAVFLMSAQYTAKSTLLIEPEPPQLLDVKSLIDASDTSDDHDYYKTQYELLRSRALAGHVVSELDLGHNKAFQAIGLRGRITNFVMAPFARLLASKSQAISPKEADAFAHFDLINRYLDGLSIEPVAGSRLVTVSYTAPDRRLAALIVDRHVHDYVRMGIELRAQAGKRAREFLSQELVEIERRVQHSEAMLNAYRHRMGIISFGVDEKNSVAAQRMADLNRALIDADARRVAAESELNLVRAGHFESLPQVVSNPAILSLEPEVRRLQAEYARLSTSFNPGYPKLDEARAQMEAAQRALNVEIGDVAQAIRRNYIAADTEEKRLQGEISLEKAKDLAINDASLQDAVLVRDVETNRQLYQNVLQRMQEMEVTEQAPLSNISIVDTAVASRFPSGPKRLRNVSVAGMMALLVGVGLAFYLDQTDDRLHTVEELEDFLGLPSLAIVPDFARLSSRFSGRKRIHREASKELGQSILPGEAFSRNLTEYDPKGYIAGTAETYRMIRTALLFSRAGSPPRIIVVASAIKGEGKTSTAANTALVFAHTGARTLLIDADLRRPSCHSMMNERNHVGLSDVLAGQINLQEAVRTTRVQSLSLLTAGTPVPNPAELLTSSKMQETITAVRETFDIVLIDTAPLMLASDSCALATMVDGVMLVAGAFTPKSNLQRACKRLEYVGAKLLGVVFNRVNINEPGHDEFLGYYRSYEQYEAEANQ